MRKYEPEKTPYLDTFEAPYRTEKQTNRFTDFAFGFLDDGEVRWKKTKN